MALNIAAKMGTSVASTPIGMADFSFVERNWLHSSICKAYKEIGTEFVIEWNGVEPIQSRDQLPCCFADTKRDACKVRHSPKFFFYNINSRWLMVKKMKTFVGPIRKASFWHLYKTIV